MRPEHWLYTIPLRLRSLFRWAQADREVDDELRDHLDVKTEQYVAQGMTQEEAHRRARLDLGGIEQTKEKCRDCAYRKPRLAHYGSRRAHVTCYTASLHLVDFKCASSFGEAQHNYARLGLRKKEERFSENPARRKFV